MDASQGKYDAALIAYKKGRYIHSSRPALLIGMNNNIGGSSSSNANSKDKEREVQQMEQQQRRIFDKVSSFAADHDLSIFANDAGSLKHLLCCVGVVTGGKNHG